MKKYSLQKRGLISAGVFLCGFLISYLFQFQYPDKVILAAVLTILFIIFVSAVIISAVILLIKAHKQHVYFSSINSVRELLRFELSEYEQYLKWLFRTHESIPKKKAIIAKQLPKNKHMNIRECHACINHFIPDVQSAIYIVTTSDFTSDVHNHSRTGSHTQYINGERLEKMMRTIKSEDPFT